MREDDLPGALAEDLEGSFERVVVMYQDRLYAFALRLMGNSHDAEEAVTDAFVRAYEAMRSYPMKRIRGLALRQWLYQITLNIVRNQRRRRRLKAVSIDQIEGGPELEDHREKPDTALERAELRERLTRSIDRLPLRERAPVVLRHVQGLGYGEIGQLLDQPTGTVKANVHRGVRRLRESLGKYRREG
jgi:RNA polymerase sigma-70 factor (ECF subfamily)